MTTVFASSLGPNVQEYGSPAGYDITHDGWVHCFGMLAFTASADIANEPVLKIPSELMPPGEFGVRGYEGAQPCVMFSDHNTPITGGVICLAYLFDGGDEASRGLYVGRTLIPIPGDQEGQSAPFAFDPTNLNVVCLNNIAWRIA